jgi:hypothetical protein
VVGPLQRIRGLEFLVQRKQIPPSKLPHHVDVFHRHFVEHTAFYEPHLIERAAALEEQCGFAHYAQQLLNDQEYQHNKRIFHVYNQVERVVKTEEDIEVVFSLSDNNYALIVEGVSRGLLTTERIHPNILTVLDEGAEEELLCLTYAVLTSQQRETIGNGYLFENERTHWGCMRELYTGDDIATARISCMDILAKRAGEGYGHEPQYQTILDWGVARGFYTRESLQATFQDEEPTVGEVLQLALILNLLNRS